MKIKSDTQLEGALRELEGLELIESDDGPATQSQDGAPQAREDRKRELRQAISDYRAARFPGIDGRRAQ